MRIGLYHNDLPVSGSKPGGVAVFVHRLARELSDRGHDVTVWTRSSAPSDANYRHVVLWPRLRTTSRFLRTFLVPLLLNTVSWGDAEVVHFHGDDSLTVHRNVPSVRTLHGSAMLEFRHATRAKHKLVYAVISFLEYLSARLATACYSVGPGIPKIYPTDGNVDNGVWVPDEVQLEREGPPSIVFVGTWAGRKRGQLLHRVFAEYVRPRIPEAELWMVSDHSEPSPGVVYVDAPDDATLRSLYARAWVMCHPSTYEGFGIPYAEAMAAGTPIVTSDNPGARHVLGDELARACIVPDAELGSTLVALLQDAPRRLSLARLERERVARYSWDAVVQRHLEMYETAIARFESDR